MSVLNTRSKSDIPRKYSLLFINSRNHIKYLIAEEQVFSLRVQNKTRCMLLCKAHLRLTLLSEAKYECLSQSESDFLVLPLQKCYCKFSIRHYCEEMCDIFPLKISNELFFVF